MKEIRFIPYGYTIRNGRMIIDHQEASIIRGIFEQYINGASLQDIADDLTKKKISYTGETDVWNKARVARIIENENYKGNEDYDPIIDERMYENAVRVKATRKTFQTDTLSDDIQLLGTRVKCEVCKSKMIRHLNNRNRVKECWICANPHCRCQVRMEDEILLRKITDLMNRIIKNKNLIIPSHRPPKKESIQVKRIRKEIDQELNRIEPNEEVVINKIKELSSQLYSESDPKIRIAERIKKRISMMSIQEKFNSEYFHEIVSYVTLDRVGKVKLITRTETVIREREGENGSCKNS